LKGEGRAPPAKAEGEKTGGSRRELRKERRKEEEREPRACGALKPNQKLAEECCCPAIGHRNR
jgi:hypothetical protein